jgi:hypothetical protein
MNAPLRRLPAAGSDTTVGVFIQDERSGPRGRATSPGGARVIIVTVAGDMLGARVPARRLRDVAALT